MNKEHKKLYKAGKLWVTATLFMVAGIAMMSGSASADTKSNLSAVMQSNQVMTENTLPVSSTNNYQVSETVANTNSAQEQSNAVASTNYLGVEETKTSQSNYDFTGETSFTRCIGQVSSNNFAPASLHVKLADGQIYQPVAGDLEFVDYNGKQIADPTTAGLYWLNLSDAGLAHISVLGDGEYSINPRASVMLTLKNGTNLKIYTVATDPSLPKITYDEQSHSYILNPKAVKVIVETNLYDQLATYYPSAGDLELIDKAGNVISSVQSAINLDGMAYFYLSPQGIRHLQRSFPFIKSVAPLNSLSFFDCVPVDFTNRSYSFKNNYVNDYVGRFSVATTPIVFQVDLGNGKSYTLHKGDYALFDNNGQEFIAPTVAGLYSLNLTATGLAHLNELGYGGYKFQSYSGLSVFLYNLDKAYIHTKFTDTDVNLKSYTSGDKPIAIESQPIQVTLNDNYDLETLATFTPDPGDLEYVDDSGKVVNPYLVGVDAGLGKALEKNYYIYLSPQGIQHLKMVIPYVKGFSNPALLSTYLAQIVVNRVAHGYIFINEISTSKDWVMQGVTPEIDLQNYKVEYTDSNYNNHTVALQSGDLAFYDSQGKLVTPTRVGSYTINATPQLIARLNQLDSHVNYSFKSSTGALYVVQARGTMQVSGPRQLSAYGARHLEKMGYTITIFSNGQQIGVYRPVAGDLELVDQGANVITNPQAAGRYWLHLSQQGMSNIQLNKGKGIYYAFPSYNLPEVNYQPYTPTAEDYQQNYGNLDSYSLRQASSTEAALHVAGWHASGASAVMPNGWLIIYDNTLGREIKRVQITPVNRPDVQAAYLNVFGSLQSGFDQDVLIPLANASDDLTVIARYSSDPDGGEGQRIDHWFNRISVDQGNHAWVDSVQFINGKLHVSGWHATNQANDKKYHTIIVWDASQGRELERTTENISTDRPDLVAVYPTIMMAKHAGFHAELSMVPEMATDQIQFISRYSSTKDANSDYVDYWFAPQQLLHGHRNQAYLDNVTVQNDKLHVSGWHVTNQSIGRPYHTIIILNANNGHELSRSTIQKGTNRPDLIKAFPDVITASQNGFSNDVTLTPGMGDQPIRIISRWSKTADANEDYIDYWFAPQQLFNDLANRANLDSWGVQGRALHAVGWHATSQSAGRPYHYLILFDQSTQREIKRVRVIANSARPDVARAFPGVYNAGDAGFDVSFKLNSKTNGHRFTVLSRWTSDPAGNGNAVDYWFDSMVAPELSLVPTAGKNSPADHDVEKAFHIDNVSVAWTKQDPQIQVSGWAASNYCADWNRQMTGNPLIDSIILDNVRQMILVLEVNGTEWIAVALDPSQNIRPDVAVAYPEIWGSRYSGFNCRFTLSHIRMPQVKPSDTYRFIFRCYSSGYKQHDDMVSSVYHF
ncbi:MBG domain-containing protein [uncultured Limosilactobacillus sp.]|uniref:KxYKxGKxW signal peptide domain-containing protein n=1 Tax=uncultured Limosilactobacillus sp. TaxID=2837629 RepID=UPI00259A31C1|nr:MBG domain-containing protein [uncultured Limosilactobacillus sp.]